jgi:translation initiation factor 1
VFEIGAKLDQEPLAAQGKKAKKEALPDATLPKQSHRLVFTYEKRNGKPVTKVGKFAIDAEQKKALFKLLKKKLACGGSIADEWIELQGDNKEKIKAVLENEGWEFR